MDDLDGSVASERVWFMLDGRHYTINLSRANAHAFRKFMHYFTRSGVETGGTWCRYGAFRHVVHTDGRSYDVHIQDVRLWALVAGVPLPAGNRVPAWVIRLYLDARSLP
jgi:hypothetical protein